VTLEEEVRRLVAAAPRGRDDLRFYQSNLLVPFLLDNPKSAAYVDMGLGKTVSILTVLDHLFSHGLARKALIVAPLRVAIQTWPTEIREWKHTLWLRHTLIRPDQRVKTGAARREQMRRQSMMDTEIHIINREQVAWLVETCAERGRWPYDVVIVDESTSFADHNSQRWKALAKVARQTKRLHLLSGTPAPEGIGDLFAQIYLLDAGERFGRGITAFRQHYMMQNPYTKKWLPQNGAMEKVSEKIADLCLVMKEEDYLDIAKPVVIERPIILEPNELKQYKDFEKTLILQLPDDVEIEALNAGVLSQKLLQYASGAVYDEKRQVHVIHDHKVEELRQLVDENPGEPLLVAYWFKPSLARLRKGFPHATVMDKAGQAVNDWNAGKIPMLFIHPQSAGHGLNMQLGPGHILIFADTPASLELYLQTIKRIARSGQKRLVRVVHLVARGTVEQYAVPKLMAKESAQDAFTNYLRAIRKKLTRRAV
jgi:SNF2 family DNA or RNA helicase